MMLSGWLTLSLLAVAPTGPPPHADPLLGPATALRAALRETGPLSLVVLADSVGAGMHLEDPATEGYPALVTDLLRRRLPGRTITLDNLAAAGQGTADFLDAFDRLMGRRFPNLVLIQLGGNDKGTGDGLEGLPGYRARLSELIRRCVPMGALPVVITPPMSEPEPGQPYPDAAAEVARAEGVPCVDADRVIKALGVDYRGLFPYFIHPREREHAAIALACDQAIAEAIGLAAHVTVSLADFVGEARLGEGFEVPVTVRNPGATPATVRLTSDQLSFALPQVTVPPGEERAVAARFQMPLTLPGGRSAERPFLVCAEADGRLAFDQKRLAVTPIVRVPTAGSPAAAAPWTALRAPALTVGRDRWQGEDDFSARISGSVDADALTVIVDVRDDQVTAGPPPMSDGLELFLDLRGPFERGRPYYTPQVALVMLPPPAGGGWSALGEDRPPQALLELPAQREVTPTGYRIILRVPRQTLDDIAGRRVTELGFDLALDDADGGGRKAQLLWLGRADNFINPRRFGTLRLEGDDPAGQLRVTVFP